MAAAQHGREGEDKEAQAEDDELIVHQADELGRR